jgi:hypothetical protein
MTGNMQYIYNMEGVIDKLKCDSSREKQGLFSLSYINRLFIGDMWLVCDCNTCSELKVERRKATRPGTGLKDIKRVTINFISISWKPGYRVPDIWDLQISPSKSHIYDG